MNNGFYVDRRKAQVILICRSFSLWYRKCLGKSTLAVNLQLSCNFECDLASILSDTSISSSFINNYQSIRLWTRNKPCFQKCTQQNMSLHLNISFVQGIAGLVGLCSLHIHAREPIRLPWDKHNAPLLLFTWKMFISTDLTNIYVLESICSRV